MLEDIDYRFSNNSTTSSDKEGITGVIFAAGIGSRLKPWTLHHPKALAKVNGRTLLQHTASRLWNLSDINNVIINIHHFGSQIVDFVGGCSDFEQMEVGFSDETERLLDTGGALLKIFKEMEICDTIVAHNADILTDVDLQELLKMHEYEKNDITLLVKDRKSSRKLLFDSDGCLKGWMNTSTGEIKCCYDKDLLRLKYYAFSGVQVLSRKAMESLATFGDHIKSDVFSVIPFYLWAKDHLTIRCYLPDKDYLIIDAGTPEGLASAELYFKK